MTDQSAVVVLEPVADVCLRMADDRAFDIQPSVRAALRMAHDALKAYETADATLYAAAPKPTLSGVEWRQRAVDAEEMIREIHHGYGVNYTGKWVVQQTGRYLDQLDALSSPLPGEPG